MKLLTLKLENFQGLRQEEFRFDGKSANIYGDNASGKTTIFNAITWLLFDKASTGAKNFTPKTKGPDGDLHYLDHAAEATFSLDDGRIVTLRKVFHENYKKKRGSNMDEFDGHSVDFYVDGVPTKEKEYAATLLNFCGNAEKMKMLTMPNYFPEELPWETRRRILLEICGDISDIDVINSTFELKELPSYLLMPGTANQYYSVDEYKKIAAAKKVDINKQLQDIPGRIDEAQRAMPDIKGIDTNSIDRKIKELTEQKGQLEIEKAQALSGDITASTIRNQIAEATAKLAEAKAAHATKTSSQNEATYTEINNIKRDHIAAKNRLHDAKNEVERAQRTLDLVKFHRETLISEYMAIQKEVWDEGAEICPTCYQTLPDEEIQKFREAFNLHKSRKLEKINQQGQKEASKEIIAENESKVKALKEQIKLNEWVIEDYEQQIAALQNQLQAPVPFEATTEYAQLIALIATYRNDANDMSKRAEVITAGFTEQIQALQEEIRKQETLRGNLRIAANQQERINQLSAKEKDLSRQYEALEKGIYLCEVFIKTKVRLLTDRINSKFKTVSFRLFQEQINGGVKEDCEVMIPAEGGQLVPFTNANNAARINAGLEIIDTLSRHWNLSMPVFVDNAESVTRLIQIDTQVIRLVVSEQDKALRTEIAQDKTKIRRIS